jgi:hypothetical protein
MLDKEFKYYLAHQDDLVKKYNGKFLVIKDEDIIGVYADKIEALERSKEKYELGSFLIQLCTPGNAAYTQTFHSRVTFSHKNA